MKELSKEIAENYEEIDELNKKVQELREETDDLLVKLYAKIRDNITDYQTKYKELRGLITVGINEYGIDFAFKSGMLPYTDGLKIIEEETGLKFIGTSSHGKVYKFHAIH